MIARTLVLATALLVAGCGNPPHAEARRAEQKATPLTAESTIGELLDDPQTRPVLDRHLPKLASHPQIAMLRKWTLRRLATDPHARGLTAQKLAEIERDLAAAQS